MVLLKEERMCTMEGTTNLMTIIIVISIVKEELLVQILTTMDTLVSKLLTNMEESMNQDKGQVAMFAMKDLIEEELIPLHLIFTRIYKSGVRMDQVQI